MQSLPDSGKDRMAVTSPPFETVSGIESTLPRWFLKALKTHSHSWLYEIVQVEGHSRQTLRKESRDLERNLKEVLPYMKKEFQILFDSFVHMVWTSETSSTSWFTIFMTGYTYVLYWKCMVYSNNWNKSGTFCKDAPIPRANVLSLCLAQEIKTIYLHKTTKHINTVRKFHVQ